MSEQKHKIQRQIIELHIPQKSLNARQMQTEMSRIYRRRILPLIDQYCSEFSAPDRIHRIDLLEIDLGQINPANFEAELVAKFRSAIQKALTTQINEQEQTDKAQQTESPKTQSQLELLSQFARTGTIPWWADAAQPDLLQDCLDYLLTTTPHDLRYLIAQFVNEKRPFNRLITHYNTPELLALINLFSSPHNQIAADFVLLLQQSKFAARRVRSTRQQIIWTALFEVAMAHQDQIVPKEQFYTAVLKRIAPRLNKNYTQLLANIHQQIQTQPTAPELHNIIEIMHQENQRTQQPARQEKTVSTLRQTLAALQTRQIYPAALWPILLAEVPDIPPHLYPSLQANLDLTLKSAPPANEDSDDASYYIQHILLLLQLTPQRLQNRIAASKNISPAQNNQLLDLAARTFVDPPKSITQATPAASKFPDPDELYVENAGLVILWPFLNHFFTHLDMLQDKQFKDSPTQQKAVGLLQYISTEASDFPEYLLPLNKILCGVDLFDVFEMATSISDAEIEECDNLLTAVITQAPILRNMSIAGFRSTFLLRQGVLRARDGAWLLQVEHLTHDVVLDRFPWSWQWVKLPWMDTALRVEW